jgi:ferredoxin-NAD(P)+ reductase (naphthalene dioxygenase ferredoxin-specific)
MSVACTVTHLEMLTHDIRLVRLVPQSGEVLDFQAGQYATIGFGGLEGRDYSFAGRPGELALEFHVRDMGSGLSQHVVRHLKPGDPADLVGPLGSATLRFAPGRPILAVAGGSGLAPIKSIVETALEQGQRAPVHLYFGARTVRDLYLLDHFDRLAKASPNLRFVPVLVDPVDAEGRRQGQVDSAISEDFQSFDGFHAYLAGPPAMVEASVALLRGRGMPDMDIHADAFYTMTDLRQRQRGAPSEER